MIPAATPVRRFLIGVAASSLLFVSACSNEPSANERAVDAVANDLLRDPVFADYAITPAEADCAGGELVTALGADRVLALGAGTPPLDPEDLGPDDITAIGTALEQCVPAIDQVIADAIAPGLVAPPTDPIPITAAQADCMATVITAGADLAGLIVLGLQPAGPTPPTLAPDQATVYATALLDCVDIRPLVLAQITGPGADAATLACVSENISDEALRNNFIANFQGQDPGTPFQAAIQTCQG